MPISPSKPTRMLKREGVYFFKGMGPCFSTTISLAPKISYSLFPMCPSKLSEVPTAFEADWRRGGKWGGGVRVGLSRGAACLVFLTKPNR